MVSIMCLPLLSKSTKSPVKCSMLTAPNLLEMIIRNRTVFANDKFRPRNDATRTKLLSENYMEKMRQKYQVRLQKRLRPKGVRLSEGVPVSLLTEIDEGLKSVLRRRQRVLDKIFMENITEILSTNPIGDFINQMDVMITQCEVTKDCKILHVFYYCDKSKAKQVVTELNKIKEMIRSLLTQKYIMGKIPTIEYIYDLAYDQNSVLTERFALMDFGPNEKEKEINLEENRQHDSPITSQKVGGGDGGSNEEFIPPIPDSEPFKFLRKARRAKELTHFDPEYAFQFTQNPYDNQKALSRFLTFNHPEDMRLDTFSLDYKNIINKLLFNLVKSRSPSQAFNPISDPLPPVDWSSVKPMPRIPPDMNDPAQNFKGRVIVMRKFLIENRKKKQLLSRQAKRIKEEMSLEASNNLNQALENIGFTADYPGNSTSFSPLDDYEYLHSKLDRMEEMIDNKEDN